MPVPPLVPTTPSPLPTDQNAEFDAKAFPWAASLNPFGESLVDIGEFVETAAVQVDADAIAAAADRVQTGLDRVQTGQDRAAAEAAALAAGVSSGLVLTGRAGNFVRVNPGETALEFLSGTTLFQLATTLAGSSAGGIEINRDGTGDRNAFVDFHSHGLPGANDNSARIIRSAGANGTLDITQTGTGAIRLQGNTEINGTIGGTVIPPQAVAEAGTDNASVMTPLRTAQAIAALAPSPTTADILAATAGASVEAVGTYIFARYDISNPVIAPGGIAAGSDLSPSNASASSVFGGIAGSWRCMGRILVAGAASETTLWLRIS